MSCRTSLLSAILLAVAGVAEGAAPKVVTDIAPTHAIVARVMERVGEPRLLVPPGTSPHGYAMRPSQAAALQDADVVFWVGGTLTPWLEGPLAALSGEATTVAFLDAGDLMLLPARKGGGFAAHDHGDADQARGGHEDEPGHADRHEDRAHRKEALAHHGADPHVWLDPVNAQAMAVVAAETLAQFDPANSDIYRANAAAFGAEIQTLMGEIGARLEPVRGMGFVVFHDAYQYFEARFDMPAAGSVAMSDAERPSAARVREIRDRVHEAKVACIFAEPQFQPALVGTVTEGTEVRSATLDPVGARLEPGAALYPRLLQNLANELSDCLGGAN